ncbi:GcrA family cell cycle regulator [Rhizobium ruizarguesonis]|uniref:GcrA family cell cycle regulator n=1 Tax=Rhizobium ruizarguesonis TaxID=2081791 RepID=UPI001031248E|nr:hypothetical protein ELH00_16390 [Rhizobium ruizarguesonis]
MNQIFRPDKGEKINLMAKLWNDGLSAREIAARIGGITRSAVLGYVHRNKDLFESRARKPKYKRTGGVRPERRDPSAARRPKDTGGQKIHNIHKVRAEAARREGDECEAGTSACLQIAPTDTERLNTGKELMALGRHECRWALTNGGPFIFCASATDGAIYCSHHAKRAHTVREAS